MDATFEMLERKISQGEIADVKLTMPAELLQLWPNIELHKPEETGMRLKSEAFEDGGVIPPEYTCESEGSSPPLTWEDVPEEAGSLVLVMDDPDDAVGDACHWLLYDIMPTAGGLREGESGIGVPGTNDFSAKGYRGPCPPEEHDAHRYRLHLYAVKSESLGLEPGARRRQVEQANEGPGACDG